MGGIAEPYLRHPYEPGLRMVVRRPQYAVNRSTSQFPAIIEIDSTGYFPTEVSPDSIMARPALEARGCGRPLLRGRGRLRAGGALPLLWLFDESAARGAESNIT